jgi:type I restriction enzyme S subunit
LSLRVTLPIISKSKWETIRIPIPPFSEQHRIVAKVEQLMALVDELEAQLAASRATATALLDAVVHELTNGKESHATAEV